MIVCEERSSDRAGGNGIVKKIKFLLSRWRSLGSTGDNNCKRQNVDEQIRNSEKSAFLRDVKKHVKDITKRSYIDPSSGTLDYVLMLVPNESIYSFINKEDSAVIDFALENKVLLCSPLTLYAILSLIHQATRNFAMEEKATEVMSLLNTFRLQWSKYVEAMDKMGRRIDDAKREFTSQVSTRTNQLQKPLNKIDDITNLVEDTDQVTKLEGQQKF